MSNKEAITLLLKKALKKGKDNLPNTWEIDQALALFKEQPPASEFTKKAREINNTENVPKWLVRRTLGETCDRLDASEASRKELKELLTEYGRHSPGCSQEFSSKYHCRCGWSEVETNKQGD